MFIEDLTNLAFGSLLAEASPETHETTLDHVIDTSGALLGGIETLGTRLERLATDLGLDGPQGSVSSRRRLAVIGATAVHAWEMDDIHHAATVCPGSVVLPVLAGAALANTSLEWGRFLAAYRAGYDVTVSVARAIGASTLLSHGWWPTSIAGPIGAVAALAVAREDRATCTAAIGIAAQQFGGSLAGSVNEADSRYLLAGMAADRAVIADAAATSGWVGPGDFFDVGRTPLPLTLEASTALVAPGEAIKETSFKRYPGALHLQAAADALLSLVRQNDIDPDSIDSIECGLPSQIAAVVDRPVPAPSRLAALVTGPFVLAVTAIAGKLTAAEYGIDWRTDAAVQKLAEKIRIVPDDALGRAYPTKWGATIVIVSRNNTMRAECFDTPGSREDPLERSQIDDKFRRNIVPLLGSERVDDALTLLRSASASTPAWEVLPRQILRLGEPSHST